MAENTLEFLSAIDSEYVIHLYSQYLDQPANVDPSWQEFFSDLNDNETEILNEIAGASWTPEHQKKNGFSKFATVTGTKELETDSAPVDAEKMPEPANTSSESLRNAAMDSVRALMLIRAFRARGHLIANLDPLGLKEIEYHPELDPAHHGFKDDDLDRPIFINGVLGMEYATIRDILQALKQTYCGSIGVEFLHLTDPEEKAWVQKRIEGPRNHTDFTVKGKKAILQRLTAAEEFEQFLHKKYPGTKRFGLDGGESLIPAMEQIMKRGGQLGLREIVLGMAHRGRLNVLTNVMGKPFSAVFSEFQGNILKSDDVQGSGDVKYHLGTSSDRDFDGNTIHLSLTSNPSHLEAVNPVVIGKARAKQIQLNDTEAEKVMPILMHGDAAFAGQGLAAETLMISELPGYRVGGTVHIVINNQIGFTTTPKYGRSGPYSTDVAKMLAAPIFHVNGDDPEAVVHVARIATEFRQKFKRDVVIDMYCYRRHGHNEGDEPSFTQPLMYKRIKEQATTREQYTHQLIQENIITQEEADQISSEFSNELQEAFDSAQSYKPNDKDFLGGVWSGMTVAHGEARRGTTAVDPDLIQKIGKVITSVPEDFNIHKKLTRIMDAKKKMFETGEGVDWATGEALAFGTLLDEGYSVRLSGQDSGRGTFSQRHATLYDQEDGHKYFPLSNIHEDQARFEVHDSPLSEAAVLGYEYGYSQAEPNALVLWEAQFGDFVNGAQVIIDQFICSGESKWLRMSGLVMLLPHGYEGQGPEHSSARLERFLQNSAEDNWQVCNCTTPANYFHVLRRQLHRDFRKPLILMTPKSLLRHKRAVSKLAEFSGDASFHRILWDERKDQLVKHEKLRRVILCSGKVYYDLEAMRDEHEIDDIRILRLEQLYPFPKNPLIEELEACTNADIVWCQEEQKNMGAWRFVEPLIEDVLTNDVKTKSQRPIYCGRPESASPATGYLKVHNQEQEALVKQALMLSDGS